MGTVPTRPPLQGVSAGPRKWYSFCEDAHSDTGEDTPGEEHAVVLRRRLDDRPYSDLSSLSFVRRSLPKITHDQAHELHEAFASELVADDGLRDGPDRLAGDVGCHDCTGGRIVGVLHVCTAGEITGIVMRLRSRRTVLEAVMSDAGGDDTRVISGQGSASSSLRPSVLLTRRGMSLVKGQYTSERTSS